MAVIIEELTVEVLPAAPSVETGAPHPAEGDEGDRWLDLLELAREREARLACD